MPGYKSLITKKDEPPSREKMLLDPLNIISNKIRVRAGGSKQSVKELLMSQLSPPRCQIDFLPATVNLDKCNALDIKSVKEPDDSSDIDNDKHGKSGNDCKERVEDEEKEKKCFSCLMNDLELSFDGEWLRNHFKLPLKMAIKEIVARKPDDPVKYLGFWLLHYRKLNERNQWKLEADKELEYYRSLVREPVVEEEQVSVDQGEEEELSRDLNFKYYEPTQDVA